MLSVTVVTIPARATRYLRLKVIVIKSKFMLIISSSLHNHVTIQYKKIQLINIFSIFLACNLILRTVLIINKYEDNLGFLRRSKPID